MEFMILRYSYTYVSYVLNCTLSIYPSSVSYSINDGEELLANIPESPPTCGTIKVSEL